MLKSLNIMSEAWFRSRKREFFYRKAKKERFRARSAYKLIDLQNKFNLIRRGDVVIDLGAAPGSWSQVALELVGPKGRVIAVDISPIMSLSGPFEAILGDICKESTIAKVKQALQDKLADVVLCDAAPKFSGIKSLDIGIALQIANCALNFATQVLKKHGAFVTKAFQGPDYAEFVQKLQKHFKLVKEVKPPASLRTSSEVYLVCLNYIKTEAKQE
jgi:23S rRNA (uridine2552-2'-O)-methyltransferase